MNNGIKPFSSDLPRKSGSSSGSDMAGNAANPSPWQQTDIVDFQGNRLRVQPTNQPFWSGMGAAVSELGKTLVLQASSHFKRP